MKQYHEHLKTILEKGSYKEPAREGMPGTTSLFGYQNRYNLQEGFPILTTKKVNFKNIIVELLWFLRGDTNIKYLVDNGCNIWNEDAYNYFIKVGNPILQLPLTFEHFINILKGGEKVTTEQINSYFIEANSLYRLGDCGFQYGKVWRQWETGKNLWDETKTLDNAYIGKKTIDQLSKVIENIKSKPYDRRKVITAVDPAHDEDLALYWCHCLFQFNCRKLDDKDRVYYAVSNNRMHRNEFMFPDEIQGRTLKQQLDDSNIPEYYLDCQMYQRSADMFLGVPYNISSYALLIHIIAKICGMIPGEFIHTFGDSHIYDNHKEQVEELLNRDYTKYKLPILKMNEEFMKWSQLDSVSLNELFNELRSEDFTLEKYESYPSIQAKLSTGLK